MTKERAEKIGIRIATISVSIGIVLAYLIPTFVFWDGTSKSFTWIFDIGFWFNVLMGIAFFYGTGYFFGKKAGVEILVKKRNYILTGIKYGVLTLITATFLTSLIGFFQEGIDNIGGFSNPFYDYIFKPMYWILMYGILPAIVVGILFGLIIKVNGNKKPTHNNV
jgi:uncharacterized RDD family membrane protein YckC